MITARTVFVLGAGTNVPYGFSTGEGLVNKARKADPHVLMGNAGRQISAQQAREFKAALEDNMLPSIDAMLEHRDDILPTGKRVMATLLYHEERIAWPKEPEQDWMGLIFRYMAEDADSMQTFANNPVSFVTFNYDRYLEYRFIRGLIARYRVQPHEAWALIQDKIIHLYGSLGDLPEQYAPGAADVRNVVPLGATDTPDVYTLGVALPIAERTLKIVHDADQRSDVFDKALQRFSAAEQVWFLGFGFGKKNVERLCLDQIRGETMIFCTCYGMTSAEVRRALFPAFPSRNMNGFTGDYDVRRFLREHIDVLR